MTYKALENFLATVAAVPERLLMKSLRHCHAELVDSIVVGESRGCLRRVFIVWPESPLCSSEQHNSFSVVGPHDHRYSLKLAPVHGRVTHTLFAADPAEHPSDRPAAVGGNVFHAWTCTKGLSALDLQPAGFAELRITGRRSLQGLVELSATQIHTLACHRYAAWHVSEGPTTRESTRLFSRQGTLPSLEGLYQPFMSRSDVVAHVRRFVHEAVGSAVLPTRGN